MVEQRVEHFLWQKRGTYYFVRRVPKDIQHHYKTSRLVICLRTKRRDAALKASRSMPLKLEDYWMTLRLTQLDIPGLHLIRTSPASSNPSSKTLSDALEVYVELKGRNKGTVFKRSALSVNMDIAYLFGCQLGSLFGG